MRELQRYTALPATFGGLGTEVCRPACTQGMTVASSETERSLLRALQAGATWTGARVRKHQNLVVAACPYVPFVNRPFQSEIHGTVNFTLFCCVLLVTWCYRVLLSCYLRPK